MKQVGRWGIGVGLTVALVLIGLAGPAAAQIGGGLGLDFGSDGSQLKVTAQFTAPRDGQPGRLFVTGKLKPGWYVYSLAQPKPFNPTKIKIEPSSDYRIGEFQASPPPKIKTEKIGEQTLRIEAHYDKVVFHAPVEFSPGVDPQKLKIRGVMTAQRCDANSCLPPEDFAFTASLGSGVDVGPVAPPEAVASQPPSSGSPAGFDAAELMKNIIAQRGERSFLFVLGLAFFGGLILNLLPCVLPVIGLKVLSFVDQAGHDRKTAIALNVWYSVGILSVFWLLAGLIVGFNLGWGGLFQTSGFNVFLAALVFTMGLAFLGVWEFPIPGFAGSSSATSMAQKEGAVGAFSKGVVTTLLATPCTGPALGSALALSLDQPPTTVFAVFTSIGLGMASPYLVIGGFPSLVRFLPRPGAWMETFKQVMGFVLLGTVVFILTFMKASYVVPTIGLLFALWAACWWIARTPVTAEFPEKAMAWLQAVAFTGVMWVLLFPGINEIVPKSFPLAFAGLHDIMAGRLEGEDDYWQRFTTRADLQERIASGNTVMVDFTADWCLTCKTLEATVLSSDAVREAVARNGVIPLKADWTDRDPEVTAMLELLGVRQVPVLAIFPASKPNEPIAFVDGYTQGMVLDALEKAGPSKPAK